MPTRKAKVRIGAVLGRGYHVAVTNPEAVNTAVAAAREAA